MVLKGIQFPIYLQLLRIAGKLRIHQILQTFTFTIIVPLRKVERKSSQIFSIALQLNISNEYSLLLISLHP